MEEEAQPEAVRAEAVLGLTEGRAPALVTELLKFARGDRPALRDEALRALIKTKLTDDQKAVVKEWRAGTRPTWRPASWGSRSPATGPKRRTSTPG